MAFQERDHAHQHDLANQDFPLVAFTKFAGHGNTKQVAETIVEGINQVLETETTFTEIKEVNLAQLDEFDIILVGSPNHMGRATKSIRQFIDKLGEIYVEGKQVAIFDTYMAGDFEKAVKKMEKQIGEKIPGLKIITPGLSIRVDKMKGPISDGEIEKSKEFGIRIATLVKE